MQNDTFNLYAKAAKYYDYDNRDHLTADIPFYLEYAQRTGNEILELGCGTGRVTIPLAEDGFCVTGIDLSDSMLAVLKKKLEGASENVKNNVQFLKDDMSFFTFDKSFDLIIAPFRAFQSLTEENNINSCLRCVHGHLKDNGLFIINAFRPYKVLDESWCYPETLQWEIVDSTTGYKITKKHWGSKIDIQQQIIYPHLAYEISDGIRVIERIEEKLSLKYYYYQQLKEYLSINGLDVKEEYGWYDKSDILNGREFIFVCRKGD